MTTPPRTSAPDVELLRLIGHGGTALVGVILLASGVAAMTSALPLVLTVSLFVFGVTSLVLAWLSWNGSRMAWAFAIALDGVLALMELFGSTKVAHLAGIPIGAAAVPCLVAATACIMLATLHADYDR